MKNFLIIMLMLLVGCEARQARRAELPELEKAKAVAVVAVARMAEPTPAPVNPVSDVCENCNGRGQVGDGVIMRTCPVCKGTGKKTSGPTPEHSVLRTLSLDDSMLANMRPQRRWQAVVVGMPGCKPCALMKAELTAQLGGVWSIAEVVNLAEEFAAYEIQGEADIIFDDNWEAYREFGMKEGDSLPCTLVFGDGEVIERINGRVNAVDFSHRVKAAVDKMPKQFSGRFEAIRGGTLEAADLIREVLGTSEKVLGPTGSITMQRPAGTVDLERAVITFSGATTITAKMQSGSLIVNCNPPPRIKVNGVPLLNPSVAGLSITREAITLDLLRWPDVMIAVK